MNKDAIDIKLPRLDILQIIDALESRAESYEKTAAYFNGEPITEIIEECSDADEAQKIAISFRDIITKIENQM